MSSLYSNNYTVVAANGQAPVDGPLAVNNFLIQSAAGVVAYTIPTSMCGAIITIPTLTDQGNVTVTINLPNPVTNPGFNCKFVLTGAKHGTQVINIIGPSNTAFHPISLRNANAFTASAVCRGLSFLTAVAAGAGSSVEVSSDGFRYSCSARSTLADGVGGLADLP